MSQTQWPGQEVAPAAARTPQPIIAADNTDQNHDNAVNDAQLGISGANLDLSRRGEKRQEANSAIQNAQILKGTYEALPAVKDYRAVLPQFMQGLKLPEDATGDQTLLYAYAKTMDPGSVVRESEQGAAANGAGFWDSTVANLKKQFGIEGGGALPPEVRLRLKRDMQQRVQEMGRLYRQQRARFADDAHAYNIDPARVIGPDDFDPYVKDWEVQNARLFGGAQGGTKAPTMVGDLPQGSVPVFNMDAPQTAFDREAYLQKTFGVTGNQESTLTAFFNANRGNKAMTLEGAKAFYQQQGIPAPLDTDLAVAVKNAQDGRAFAGFDTSAAEKAYRQQLQQINQQNGSVNPNSALAPADLAGNALLFNLGDEAMGVQRGLGAALMGQDPIGAYQVGRDAARLNFEQTREASPGMSTAAELAGGVGSALLMPGAIGSGVAGVARAGGAAGALSGYGSGEGFGGSVTGALVGGGTGAVLGAAGGKTADYFASRAAARIAQPLSDGAQVIQAADNLNTQFGTKIAPMPADVAGPGIQRATGAAAQLPLAAQPIVSGARRVSSEAEKARDAIAALAGTAVTPEAASEAALTGARKFIQSSRTKVAALFSKAERMGGDEPIDLATARQTLDANIAELEQVPGGGDGLAQLKALRAQLDQPYPVKGIRQMRTQMRDKFMGDGLRGSDLERRIGQVMDAADADITAGLNAVGKGDAARAYAEASAAHAERVGVIDNVLSPIIGAKGSAPKSVEQIMTAIDTATRTNGGRLGKFLESLPIEDAATVRATLISRLGRAGDGAQNAEGSAFNLGSFLTQWNQMSNSAKSQLFGGELRSALENLAKVAEGTKGAQRFANHSNTGSSLGQIATGAMGAGLLSHPLLTAAGWIGQYGGGVLLSRPSFARWLAKMPVNNPGALPAHIRSLSRIAANDNAIAGPARELAKHLSQTLLGQIPRSAASAPAPNVSHLPTQAGGGTGTQGPPQ